MSRPRDPADFEIIVHLSTFAGHRDDAWERGRQHHWYLWWEYEDMEAAVGRTPPAAADPAAAGRAGGRDARRDRARQSRARRRAAARLPDGGERRAAYIARSYWPGMDPAGQRESITVFAEEVAPLLRDAPGSGGGGA